MFISCKSPVVLREGKERYSIPAGFIGEVPSWVEKHWYFNALCKSGVITAVVSTRDKDIESAEEKAARLAAEKAAKEALATAIDDAKNAAKVEAEAEAVEKGLDEGALKKLIAEKQKAAVAKVRKEFSEKE